MSSKAEEEGGIRLGKTSKSSIWNEVSYFFAVAFVAGVACALNLLLWSAPYGLAATTMHWLIDRYEWYMYPMGIATLIVLFLYIFDFFWPPHILGEHCMLWKRDYCVGRFIFIVALLLFTFSAFLMTKDYPSIPIVITLLAEPAAVCIFRILARPAALEVNDEEAESAVNSRRVSVLNKYIGEEEDILAFFKGCATAFCAIAIACLAIFFASFPDAGAEAIAKLGKENAEMCWSTPLIIAIANLLFAVFVALRGALQNSYTYTNNKGELMMSHTASHLHADHIKELYMYVKIAGIIFCVLAGLTYAIITFSSVDEDISNLVMGLLGVFGILLALFSYASFHSVTNSLGTLLRDLPAWKAARKWKDNDWVKAFFACVFLQLFPFVIIMSFLNQSVRKVRGVYAKVRAQAHQDGQQNNAASTDALPTGVSASSIQTADPSPNLIQNAENHCLTPRVSLNLSKVKNWNAYSVIFRIKMFCLLFLSYYVVQPCCNIVFAYLKHLLAGVDFGLILILTFLIGVVAFMLPFVPGMTVYIFGGLIVADQCPPEFGGFWGGAFWNILLCWGLKLAACAVQQKIIGETLGKTFYIRSMIGVHTFQVRCFEKILRKRGWTLGKVALLCGGPDWPVSVTAGILKLSLVQCEIGTIPIIFFVAPCALTGSLYAAPKDSNYDTLFNLMLFLSLAFTGVMSAVIAWAVQHTYEENRYELSRRLPQNVDLHFQDMINEQISAKATIPWEQVPTVLKWLHVGQAIVDIWCCTVIYWAYYSLFGTFEVTDDINTLVIYGDGGIFNLYSVAVLAVWFLTWMLHYGFNTWKKAQTRQERIKLEADLRKTEQDWKANWLKEAEDEERQHQEQESTGPAKETVEEPGTTAPAQLFAADRSEANTVEEPRTTAPSQLFAADRSETKQSREEELKSAAHQVLQAPWPPYRLEIQQGNSAAPEHVVCKSCGNTGAVKGKACTCPYGDNFRLPTSQPNSTIPTMLSQMGPTGPRVGGEGGPRPDAPM